MLIESFALEPDAAAGYEIRIAAPPATVYRALWTADFRSPVVTGLMALRSLPALLLHPRRARRPRRRLTLETLVDGGFGRLAEEPGREIVLGVAGRFWRPTGNVLPFRREDFSGAVAPGLARAVWNFAARDGGDGWTVLSTETRVVCGDAASRQKFRRYWRVVAPFSGLIRRSMLRAVRREAERSAV